ncbi:MAG: Cna B-type domain-containing protein, partial [Firmicutes bacterium]|nr:Cna B-type domain-containing protein [Bacillota bacterium]
MKKKTIRKGLYRAACALYALVFAIVLLAGPASAASTGSLTLSYKQDGTEFSVYRVAVYSGDNYKLVGDFSSYSVELPGTSWRDTATTLAAYAARDNITPTAVGTIENDTVTFEDLKKALYLVVGTSTTSDGYIYTPAAFLVHVTSAGALSVVKYDMTPVEPEKIDCTVVKSWSGDSASIRPSSVKIELLCDGEIYDTVNLSDSNTWSYTWTGLDSTHEWQIVEPKVPSNYSVSVSQDGYTFTVTNTYTPDEPEETTTEPEETTTEPEETTTE